MSNRANFEFIDEETVATIKPALAAAQYRPDSDLTAGTLKALSWGSIGGIALISNLQHYMAHRDEITEWCDANLSGWALAGVTLVFKSEADAVLFKLRWC